MLTYADVCRYSGVVHLVTAADGAEEHYNLDSNAEGVRTETAEQAVKLVVKLVVVKLALRLPSRQ